MFGARPAPPWRGPLAPAGSSSSGRRSTEGLAVGALLLLSACRSGSPPAAPDLAPRHSAAQPAPPRRFTRLPIPRIDLHAHVTLGAAQRAARFFEGFGVVHAVNLSGPAPEHGLADYITDAEIAYDRLSVFTNLNWALARQPGYGARMAADLTRAKALGARGVKIPKGLGLGYVGPDRKLIRIDAPELDVVFEQAGALGLPVAIHSGDPKAFWEPDSPSNERHDELEAHPEWGFAADHQRGELPGWQELFDAFARRVARHPKTIFIGVHFGNDPEDPAEVSRLLDRCPNLYIDIAARVPAIGRRDALHDRAMMRAFFLKHQDRVLFGTDVGVGVRPRELMFGSNGKEPPTLADGERFYESVYRYLETEDQDIPSPTPIQGRWTIDGVGLPREVLEKIYYKNALTLLRPLGMKMPASLLPVQHKDPVPEAPL